uniref:Phospholipase A2, group XIIA n=1 Tax=Oryzias sinensis TaxID=183150 RepID=A0A8C7XXS3_9TELE
MRLETLLSVGGSTRTMTSPNPAWLLLFSLLLCGRFAFVSACKQEPETPDWRMTLKTIRNGIHKIDTYLNAALDLFGGDDGLCHYKCSDGYKPIARPGYKPSPPNGCGSPLFGFQFDIGIPSMTKCCNQHDRCYDTCGREKHDCDEQFQECLETICRNVQRTLGLAQSVQGCESGADEKMLLEKACSRDVEATISDPHASTYS